MSLQNLHFDRVFRAVLIVTAIGSLLSFGACYCFLISELLDEVDPNADLSTQQEQLQRRAPEIVENVLRNPPAGLNILFLTQLGLIVLLAFWQSYWAARAARTPEQAGGYGLAVGVGVLVTYGMLLLIFGPVAFVYKLAFYAVLLAGTLTGGRLAGQRIDRFGPAPEAPLTSAFPAAPLPSASARAENAQIYYNMGVTAAQGGRRDEARQHFTRALQLNPRFLLAWLELANLAETPEQAWDYIQQARALEPDHPGVVQAVNIIWPQIADKAGRGAAEPPTARPPFRGAPPDDPGIIRSQLPPQAPPQPLPAADVIQFPVEAPPELAGDQPESSEPPPSPDDNEDERPT